MKPKLLLITSMLCLSSAAFAAEPAVKETVQGNIFRPAKVEATPERIATLKLPEGFGIRVFAKDLKAPRMMAVGPDGSVYVTRRAPHGDVLKLPPDGKGEPETVARIPHVHGIAVRKGKMYLAAVRELYVADVKDDGSLGEIKRIYHDLPDAGQHPNRTLAFSPQGDLMLSVGSTANAAPEPNPESATLLKVRTDGSGRSIFASGLRNTIGFDWHPETGELYGMDHGIDWLGDDVHGEELNLLREGSKYGWPYVFEDGKRNPGDDPKPLTGKSWEEYAKMCEAPLLTATPHSAPMALLFYRGVQFPKDYAGDAFVTFHGSWNRGEASGYKIARLKFKDGKPQAFEDFVTGFYLPEEKAQFGRPCGLALHPDGSLLVSDDGGGVIYQIRYDSGS